MKKTLSLISCILLSVSVFSQKSPVTNWNKTVWKNKTVNFESPVFLSDIDSVNTGNTHLTYLNENNKIGNAYYADQTKGFSVKSERFLKTKEWTVYGNFEFSKYEDLGRKLTVMNDPYRDNPYQIADSSAGDWRKQHYLLQAKVLSPKINRFTKAALGLKYEIKNGARQMDPRPLDKTSIIELTPALLFDLNSKQKLGAHFYFNHYREDLSISLENHLRTKEIYKTLGLGEFLYNAPIIVSSGISRAYSGKTLGGGLSLGQNLTPNRKIRSQITYRRGNENAVDGSSIPFQAGNHKFSETILQMSYTSSAANADHSLMLNGSLKNISNYESVQVLNGTTQQYEVIHTSKMHQMERQNIALRYQTFSSAKKMLLAAEANYYGMTEKYPSTASTQTINQLNISIEAQKWLKLFAGELEFTYKGGYNTPLQKELIYFPKSFSNNFVANQILLPNHAFYSLNQLTNSLGAAYYIHQTDWSIYLKANYQSFTNLNTNTYYPEKLYNHQIHLTLGILN